MNLPPAINTSAAIQDKERKIKILSVVIWVGLFAAIIFHYIAESILHRGYQWSTFLFDPSDRFMDFYNTYDAFTEHRFNISIFPTVPLFLFLFSVFQRNSAFLVFLTIFICYFLWRCWQHISISRLTKGQNIQNTGIIALMSYPFIFTLDRGNMEAYMFVFVSLFVFLFQKRKFIWASFFLALAVGMKLFPAIFIVLYLKEKRYKELGIFFSFILLLGLSLFLAKDLNATIARSKWFFDFYINGYIIGDSGFPFGHSLFALVKAYYYTTALAMGQPMTEYFVKNSGYILNNYSIFTFVTYAAVAFFIYRSRKLTYWRQVCILTILFCLLPNVSGDYKLLHLITPLLLYINTYEKSRYEQTFIYLFGLLLIPKAYYVFPIGVSTAVILTPVIMLIFLYLLIWDNKVTCIQQHSS